MQETYPSTPPVWFSESEDANVSNALTSLADTSGLDNHLLYQVKLLLRQLCTLFGLPTPKFDTLDTCSSSSPSEAAAASSSSSSAASRGGGATGSLGEASCSSSSGAVSVNDAKDEETSEEESEEEEEEEMEDGEEDEDEEIPLDMEDPVAEAASKKARQDDEIHSEHIQVS